MGRYNIGCKLQKGSPCQVKCYWLEMFHTRPPDSPLQKSLLHHESCYYVFFANLHNFKNSKINRTFERLILSTPNLLYVFRGLKDKFPRKNPSKIVPVYLPARSLLFFQWLLLGPKQGICKDPIVFLRNLFFYPFLYFFSKMIAFFTAWTYPKTPNIPFTNSSQAISPICMKLATEHLWTLLTKSY